MKGTTLKNSMSFMVGFMVSSRGSQSLFYIIDYYEDEVIFRGFFAQYDHLTAFDLRVTNIHLSTKSMWPTVPNIMKILKIIGILKK